MKKTSHILFATFICTALIPLQAFAEPPRKIVTASATEEVQIQATLVKAVVAVQESAAKAEDASKKAAEKADAVLGWLKNAKVSKLQTQGLMLSPQYNYNNGVNRIVGYQAQHAISFEVVVESAGEVLDAVIEKGASRIDSVTFSASDDALASAKLKAIERATLSAKEQGEAALKALGAQSRGVSEISVNAHGNFQPFPMPQGRILRAAAMDAAPSTPIEGGELSISASVTVGLEF